jgi:hypothetical protein
MLPLTTANRSLLVDLFSGTMVCEYAVKWKTAILGVALCDLADLFDLVDLIDLF